jgi:hypothetical protein
MSDLWSALTVFVLLCCAGGVGSLIRSRLHADHLAHDTTQAVYLMITMLVTFAALVLGLLTASTKASYDNAVRNDQNYSLQLAGLDQCLRNYGPQADAARFLLRQYTAEVIASTWPLEPAPIGVTPAEIARVPVAGGSAKLGGILNNVGLQILHFTPASPFQEKAGATCQSDFQNTLAARMAAIEADHGSIVAPFSDVMVFWLFIIFATLGLVAPRNRVSIVGITLSATSLSLAIFVIADLSHPYGGLFTISSDTTRAAFAQMIAP